MLLFFGSALIWHTRDGKEGPNRLAGATTVELSQGPLLEELEFDWDKSHPVTEVSSQRGQPVAKIG